MGCSDFIELFCPYLPFSPSLSLSFLRMIDWLSWPLAHHVEMWVIALLKGLAAVQKFTILIDVTLLKIELVGSVLTTITSAVSVNAPMS